MKSIRITAVLAAATLMTVASAGTAHADHATVRNNAPGKTPINLTVFHVNNTDRTVTMTATAAELPATGDLVFTFNDSTTGVGGGVEVIKEHGQPVGGAFFTTNSKGRNKRAKCKPGTATWSTGDDQVRVVLPQSCWTAATGKDLPDAWFFTVTNTKGKKYDFLTTPDVNRG